MLELQIVNKEPAKRGVHFMSKSIKGCINVMECKDALNLLIVTSTIPILSRCVGGLSHRSACSASVSQSLASLQLKKDKDYH
jgi:hypothetical protein